VVLVPINRGRGGWWPVSGRRRPRVRVRLPRARLLRTCQYDLIGRCRFRDLRPVLYLKGRELAVVIDLYASICIEQMEKRNRLAAPPWLEFLKSRDYPGQSAEDEREREEAQQRP